MKFQSPIVTAALCLFASLASAQNYSCVTFTLPLDSIVFSYNRGAAISGLNTAGQVVGNTVYQSSQVGFLREVNGSITYLVYPGAISTSANGINNAGQIIGTYVDVTQTTHVYLRQADGTYVTVPQPSDYATAPLNTIAGLNDNGGFGVSAHLLGGFTPIFAQDLSGNLLYNANPNGYGDFALPTPFAINNSQQLLITDLGFGGVLLDGPSNASQRVAYQGAISSYVFDTWAFGLNNNGVIAGFWENLETSGGIMQEGPDYPFIHPVGSANYPALVCPSYLTDGFVNATHPLAINDKNQVAGTIGSIGPSETPIGFIATPTGTAPGVHLSQSSYNLGNIPVGKPSGPASVTISNNGSGPLHVLDTTFTAISFGALSAAPGFEITSSTCSGTAIEPGKSCSISFQWTPQAKGSQSASLVVSDDAPNAPQIVAVSGFGGTQDGSVLKLSNSSWTFSAHAVGQTSGPGKIYIYNEGPYPVTTTGFTLGGNDPSNFKLLGTTCGATLVAYRTCSVSFDFTPSSVTQYGHPPFSAIISLNDDSLNGPIQIPVKGDGTQ